MPKPVSSCKKLDRLELWNRTVVVFVSDHGYHTGHHGMWHKQTLFEQSARVPLIIAGPGRQQGAVSGRVVELIDLLPTLAALCNLPAQEAWEGTSLVPLLNDPQRSWDFPARTVEARVDRNRDRGVVGHSLRTERFRYTEWDQGKQGMELYDHDRDPSEQNNLYRDPAFEETIAGLRRSLRSTSTGRLP